MPGSISNETSIANLCLTRLGAQRISDLDTEQTENAAKIRAVFDFLRDEVLRGHTWNFATKRVNFNKLTTTPLYGFANQFQIPGNVLRILPSSTGLSSNLNGPYKVEEDKILTDDATFQCRCILRIEDTNQWDSTFVEVFATRLQAELAYAIVNNRSLASDLTNVYLSKLRSAKAYNAMEDTPDPLQADVWINARNGGSFAPNNSLGT